LFIIEINEKSSIYVPKKECLNPLMIFPESFVIHICLVDHELSSGAFIYIYKKKKKLAIIIVFELLYVNIEVKEILDTIYRERVYQFSIWSKCIILGECLGEIG